LDRKLPVKREIPNIVSSYKLKKYLLDEDMFYSIQALGS
jgi:hypothetical protein